MVNCPNCNTPMVLRNGKHGEFYYCGLHGTISKRVADMLWKRSVPHTRHTYNYNSTHDDALMQAITHTGMSIARHMDDLGLLVEDEIDSVARADWDEDSWMNVRPY